MKTIALCMIVKNEAHVIKRCIESVLPLIDYVLIVDTGSTDGTQSVIREFLQSNQLAGEVIEEPWHDFASSRTFALRKMRERTAIDYSLMIDADQVVVYDPDFDAVKFKQNLQRDLYDVRIRNGNVEYLVPQLASNRINIFYRGIVHEFRECPRDCSRGLAQGVLIQEVHDGARGRNEEKYADDAAVLEQALEVETDPFLTARYTFYLAQSFRDAGQAERALQAYLKRAEQGYWTQEIFYSLYSAAKLQELLGHSADEILETFWKAWLICPQRAEALHSAARFCRINGRHEQGYKLAKRGLRLPCPQNGLFVERWIYDFGLLDEFSALAFSSGRYGECVEACSRLLNEHRLPEDQYDRIRQNAHFAVEKLGAPPTREDEMPTADAPKPAPAIPSFVDDTAAVTAPTIATSRYAIVTPYFRENRAVLERCLNSVRRSRSLSIISLLPTVFPSNGSTMSRCGISNWTVRMATSAIRRAALAR